MAKTSASDEIMRFVRHLLEQWEASGRTFVLLAEKIERSSGYVSQVKAGKVGMSLDTLILFAGVYGWKLSDLELHAREWREGKLDNHVELPERYPNRAIAAEFALKSGVPKEAVDQVLSESLKESNDRSPEEWFEDMKAVARMMRRGVPPGRVIGPDEPDDTAPKLPPRKGKK